jgi:hypothetical protein
MNLNTGVGSYPTQSPYSKPYTAKSAEQSSAPQATPFSYVPKADSSKTDSGVPDMNPLFQDILKMLLQSFMDFKGISLNKNSIASKSSINNKVATPAQGAAGAQPATAPTPAQGAVGTQPAATPTPAIGGGGHGRGQDLQAQGGNIVEVAPGGDVQAAVNSAAEGSVIKLGAGVYNVADLNIYKSITLDGTEGTIFDGQNQAKKGINISNAPNVTVQDISFRNYTDQGIYANGVKGMTLQNIDMQKIGDNAEAKSANNNDTGIMVDGATDSVIRNVSMDDIKKKGIGLGVGKNNTIENVAITNINKEGHYDVNNDVGAIKTMLETGTTIRNNQIGTVVNGNSLWVDSGGAGSVVEGNSFTDSSNKRGVYIEKTPNTTVTNNGGTGMKHEITSDGKGNTKLSGNQGTYEENGKIYKVGNELQNIG